MSAPRVTFVVATYQRVDALGCALRSLVLQDLTDWEAIVVGDCCGEETAAAIRQLNDPRIRYYNLPRRFGEQSGPNNFGLHLAGGEHVTFFNHDDMLLRDHLTHALERLSADRADFFIGRCANMTRLEQNESGQVVPIATKLLPVTHDLNVLVQPNPYLFDPSSFWVTKTAFARRVGRWRPARDVVRTPLRDWLMRSWRMGARFSFGEQITGARFWTQNLRRGGPLYAQTTPEHQFMLARLQRESSEEIRRDLMRQIFQWRDDPVFNTQLMPVWRRKVLAMLYRRFGFDHVAWRARRAGQPRGATMNRITVKRTGAELPPAWNLDEVLHDPNACRVL